MSTTIIYSGATQGWITVNAANESAPTLKDTTYNVQYLVVAGKLPAPPPPTVIGIAVPAVTVKDLQATNLKPPAPPPDP